jgi:predicted nucleic acid-binding protein
MLYCDTSALLKLYIEEASSNRVKSEVAKADAVAVCRIAWAEAFAALARRAREVPEDRPAVEAAKTALTTDWPHYVVLEVSQSVVERAGDYADTFALRGYDSVQLAAAYEAGHIVQTIIDFACFDVRLNRAAQVLGMRVLDAA